MCFKQFLLIEKNKMLIEHMQLFIVILNVLKLSVMGDITLSLRTFNITINSA
jgi:hypothetical protein